MHIFRPFRPVKFRSGRSKTVGGVLYTRYLLLEGGGGAEGRNVEYHVPSLFFEKAGDKNGNKIKMNSWQQVNLFMHI